MFSSNRADKQYIMECNDDHIYENVTNRYKYRILNGIISSFASKARDFNILTRKRDKYIHVDDCPSSMNEYNTDSICEVLDDDTSIFERNFEYQMDYENSYTSCEDDNIYENLEYFNDDNFNNSSLNNWIMNLTYDVAEYESDNIMFVKSIPSVFSVKRNSRDLHRQLNRNQITLNFLKILWDGENVDIMSLLLQTFSNLLRDQNKQRHSIQCNNTDCSSLVTKVPTEKVSLKKLKKSKKKIDKRIYQKFENVILSSSLNIIAITYNKSQNFYFILGYSEVLFRLPTGASLNQIVRAIKNCFYFNFVSKFEEKEFYTIIKRLLHHKLKEIVAKSHDEQVNQTGKKEEIDNISAIIENNTNSSENIYQQIWTCQSISNDDDKTVIINCENIYSSVDYARASDDSEWEVDSEFSFMNTKESICNENMTNPNYYKTIWVYYSDENPEYNKIIYDESCIESLQAIKDNNISNILAQEEEDLYSDVYRPLTDVNKSEIPQNWFGSVEEWKTLLRSPFYCEDEEDIIVNDSIVSSDLSYYSDIETESVKDVTAHSSSFSLLDESSSIKSSHESYRSLNEDAEISSQSQSESFSSPKKEREGFRDKLKSKLKMGLRLDSGKQTFELNSSPESLSKAEEEAEKFIIFGCNLEKIEKHSFHKDVPKILVECINFLELEINIKTPGIYRISGNKNTIDAIKKKLNEGKKPKKETRFEFLQSQDVHTLTGLLKMFFRELKPPLMTKQTFTQCTSERLSTNQMRKILTEMPVHSYATLKFLFKHLKSIEKLQDENLMNSGNLAICLGLCLFSNSFGDAPNPFDSDISKCNMLCKYLIDNYNDVFESNDEAR